MLKTNAIYQGDCMELMKEIPDASIDFICADVPYGMTDMRYDKKKNNLAEMWTQLKRIVKPYSAIALFGSSKFSYELYNSNLEWFKYKWIWVKNQATMFMHCHNAPLRKFEEILIFSDGVINHDTVTQKRMKYNPQGVKDLEKIRFQQKKKLPEAVYNHGTIFNPHYTTQTNFPTDVLFFKAPSNVNKPHPNAKPVDLLEYLIKTYSNVGEVVLDFTCGSGSTCVAAVNCGRQFIGIELDEKYFEIACDRVQAAEDKLVNG